MNYELRDYQERGIEALRDGFRKRQRRLLLVMPTGAGKTLTLADMVGASHRKGKRVLWLTDREELAEQAGDAFTLAGVGHSFIMAGHEPDKFGTAWVGTIQSYLARRKAEKFMPGADFIVIDEAHRTMSVSFQTMLDDYPNAHVVGLTATPIRGDGCGLGNTFEDMVTPVTMQELMERGFLVRPRYFIPSKLNFDGMKGKGGDYSKAELEKLAENNPQLIGDVVENFARICPDRQAVAFPMTIAHSIALRDAFNAAGITACHVDGTTPKDERKELMRDFKKGEYQVLTSVNIAIEGLDVPAVSAVILARPTKSERIWVQAVGRGLRSSPGKDSCIVLDHAGVYDSFGPAEDFTPPPLHSKKGQQSKGGGKRKKKSGEITCEECGHVFNKTNVCPECAHVHEYERAAKTPEYADAQLAELTPEGMKEAAYALAEKKRWYAELLGFGTNRSYGNPSGFAYHKFMEKFGEKPGAWQNAARAQQPGPEVARWIKARQIAYAKQQEVERARNAAD